jgi:TatD DNase family protein
VHPDNEGVTEPSVDDLLQRAALPRVVAIGETGLDYYQMDERKGGRTVGDMEWQRERFRRHIRAARQCGKPLIIHTRAASADTLAILKEEGEDGSAGSAGGVFHCFTETAEVARAALDLGFHISFSGIVTFKNAADLREVAAFVPR